MRTSIAFFIYNRPDTTPRVFDRIRNARPPRLWVFADGPRSDRPSDEEACKLARDAAEPVDWDCEVIRDYSDSNLGCKVRLSSGLDKAMLEEEELIVLEDDILPHPTFFEYCEEMLERYRFDERVMMVTGTNYLLDSRVSISDHFFSRYFAVWGWASWRRAWRHFDISMKDWPSFRSSHLLDCYFPQPYMRRHLRKLFDEAWAGRLDTWDTQWFYSCLFSNGLCVVPERNLVSNIGITGTHTGRDLSNHNFPVWPFTSKPHNPPGWVMPDREYEDKFFRRQFYQTPAQRFLEVALRTGADGKRVASRVLTASRRRAN